MINTINIMPTTACNIRCRHCGLDESIREAMEDETLEKLLADISKSSIQDVSISGGEPLSEEYKDRLLYALRSSEIGKEKEVAVQTNCSWAKSRKRARQMVDSLKSAGVSHLSLSMDTFHQEFVPLKYVANAVNACLGVFESVIIETRSIESTYGNDVALVKKLAKKLGKSIEMKAAGIYFIGKNVYVKQGGCLIYGRAAQHFTEQEDPVRTERFKANESSVKQLEGCDKLVPTIMPDGSLLPCCYWPISNSYEQTRFGRYPEMSLESFEKAMNSGLVPCIREGDWMTIYKFLKDKSRDSLRKKLIAHTVFGITDACDFCTEFFRTYSRHREYEGKPLRAVEVGK